MHLQSLKLLCSTVSEEMHLQEKFDLILTQGQDHINHCPLHHEHMYLQNLKLLRPMVKGMHLQEKIFDLTLTIAQYPLHHVTYAPAKFHVATSHGNREDAFTRKYII